MKKSIIVLIGKPGAGKGTLLSKGLDKHPNRYEVLSVSKLLKDVVKSGSEKGQIIKKYMDNGELVPDYMIINMVLDAINATEKDVILDGFPRTMGQAEAMLEAGIIPNKAIEVCLDDETIIERAKDRLTCTSCREPFSISDFNPPKVEGICDKCGSPLEKRADDALIEKRLSEYSLETYPILALLDFANIEIVSISNKDIAMSEPEFTRQLD